MESKIPTVPTTLDGIKRSAKRLKRELGLKHAQALDLSAQRSGFENFRHAQKSLKENTE